MVEGLGRFIHNTLPSGTLHSLSLHGGNPLAYQQFVDDNLLFGNHSVQEARALQDILRTFSKAFGTTINLENLKIFFFNTDDITK